MLFNSRDHYTEMAHHMRCAIFILSFRKVSTFGASRSTLWMKVSTFGTEVSTFQTAVANKSSGFYF